jgi:hypothetical protein
MLAMDLLSNGTSILIVSYVPTSSISPLHNVSSSSTQSSSRYVSIFTVVQYAFQVLCLVVGLVGLVANGVVLFVLLRYKQLAKNATNKFIFNQTLIDATGCLALTVYVLVKWYAESASLGNGFSAWMRCLIIDTTAPIVSSSYASHFGLIVITVERYAMIVHPVGHRKHFKPWMIYVGLVVPWFDGFCVYVIPNWSTTRVVGGQCVSFGFWPAPNMMKSYVAVVFVWQFVLTILIMIFCYARIIIAIRRQARTTSHVPAPASTAAAAVAGALNGTVLK